MRSAARMLVIPPNQSQADLLMAHSLKQALRHPWDFMGNALQHEDGATLWSQHNPCIKGLKRVASPRVTGDQGGRVGQYFRFPSSGMIVQPLQPMCLCTTEFSSQCSTLQLPWCSEHALNASSSVTCAGTYSILGHAQDGNVSIISRHSITVCDWKPTGVWSDRCIWNVPPTQYADVVIEEGMDVTLDTEPPPLSSLTVSPIRLPAFQFFVHTCFTAMHTFVAFVVERVDPSAAYKNGIQVWCVSVAGCRSVDNIAPVEEHQIEFWDSFDKKKWHLTAWDQGPAV